MTTRTVEPPPPAIPAPSSNRAPAEHPEAPGGRRRRRRRSLRGWLRTTRGRVAAAVVLALLLGAAVPAGSYVAALTAPGDAAWTTRTVDWLRDHGASPLVDTAENWWYSLHPPSDDAPATAQLPPTGIPVRPRQGGASDLPDLNDPYAARRLPGEAVWQPRSLDAAGALVLATGFVRPDPDHAGVVAAVAWARSADVRAHLVAGTTMPGGPAWPGQAQVPASAVPDLVATFNSGWRTKDISGGFRVGDQTWPALQPGQATAVIDSRGRLDVGAWGRDVGGADVVAARQNLALVVDGGRAVAGLASNARHQWGYRDNQHQFTDRSGLGVDRAGDLVYVAGAGMTLEVLAQAMVDAGVVRGMQLDVHHTFPFFAVWTHRAGADSATKLLPSMAWTPDRYLRPDQRDFFYLTSTSPPP